MFKDVDSDHAQLWQFMLVEDSKRCINSDLKSFLDETTNKSKLQKQHDYALTQVQNPIAVIHLTVSVIHLPPNPTLLVKTKVKIPYRSLFAIIASNGVTSFLSACS